MANINPLIDLTEPITRQELFDMWSTGAFSNITVDDFAEGFSPTIIGSSFSEAPVNPEPGQLFWHQTENVMYCYHDVVEDTGVSLWLAIGPDKFETAMLTVGPVACGAGVEVIGPGRHCRVHDPGVAEEKRHLGWLVAGFNQSHINSPPDPGDDESVPGDWVFFNTEGDDSGATYFMGETAQSGEWVRVGIDGMLYMASAPGSEKTDALANWTNAQWISVGLSFPGTIIQAEHGGATLTPYNQIIGASPFYNLREGSLTRTEPWWLTKVAFSPRIARDNEFNE